MKLPVAPAHACLVWHSQIERHFLAESHSGSKWIEPVAPVDYSLRSLHDTSIPTLSQSGLRGINVLIRPSVGASGSKGGFVLFPVMRPQGQLSAFSRTPADNDQSRRVLWSPWLLFTNQNKGKGLLSDLPKGANIEWLFFSVVTETQPDM